MSNIPQQQLCLWRPGDAITAHRLNLMTCAINKNTDPNKVEGGSSGSEGTSLASSTLSGISGRFFTGIPDEFLEDDRGVVLDDWSVNILPTEESTGSGVYLRCGGIESALEASYPSQPCIKRYQEGVTGHEGNNIYKKILTDKYGKPLEVSYCITPSLDSHSTTLWSGCDGTSTQFYTMYRRVGRIVNSCYEMAHDSTPINRVIATNDTVMPIIPGYASSPFKSEGTHSAGLLAGIRDNTALIKNIANYGGIKIVECSGELGISSGVEFYASGESVDNHIEPKPFNRNILCIPVTYEKYNWNDSSSAWESAGCDTGDRLVVCAKTDNNWQIFFNSNGLKIPVYIPSSDSGGGGVIENDVVICEGCGIDITRVGNKYTIAIDCEYQKYVFDCEWFTVSDSNAVTLNQTKIQEVADTIAVGTTVTTNVTRVMERTTISNGYEGDIMARVTGLCGGLCANASVTWETGTHQDEG